MTPLFSLFAAARRFSRLALAILLVATLGACATDFRVDGRFEFRTLSTPNGKPITWPQGDEETPRYMFVGELLGEQNYETPTPTGIKKVGYWLAGLLDAPVQLELWRPVAGTVDRAGRIYVTDMGRHGIMVFDRKEGFLEFWGGSTEAENFLSPSGIVATDDGFVLVADADLQRVIRLDRTGKAAGVIGAGLLKRPNGLAFDEASGRLFVVDTHAHDIKVFDRQGALLEVWGKRGEENGTLNFPSFAAFANGRLYVTDTMNARIQVFDGRDGTVLKTLGQRGLRLGQFVRPKGIAVDGDENLYVVESMHDHLLVYNRDGDFLIPIGGNGYAIGSFYLPAGVWTDPDNRIYVADMFNGRVMVFQYLGGDAND